MVDNVTKTTFFSKFFKSSLFPENLSLKKLIQQELVRVISIYQEQYPEVNKVNNWQQIMSVLEHKIILCSPQNSSYGIVYRCAIAFPLGSLVGLSPVVVARQLLSLLVLGNETTEEIGLEINVIVVDSGWLDFTIYEPSIIHCYGNKNLYLWLNYLVTEIPKYSRQKLTFHYPKKSKKIDNLFPLQYIYGRCFSLLSLAARESLISLKPENNYYLEWLIEQPKTLFRGSDRGKIYLFHLEEHNLIWCFCLMLDFLATEQTVTLQKRNKLSRQLSDVWLRFVAKCNFCRAMSPSERDIAMARLGLIALTRWCIEAICLEKFNLVLQKEI